MDGRVAWAQASCYGVNRASAWFWGLVPRVGVFFSGRGLCVLPLADFGGWEAMPWKALYFKQLKGLRPRKQAISSSPVRVGTQF
jgi:hypothetical protein